MKYCINCGKQLNDTAEFCSDCGVAVKNKYISEIKQDVCDEQATTATVPNQANVADIPITKDIEEPKGKLSIGFIIWSVVNLIFGFTLCGIIGLVLTIIAGCTKISTSKKLKKGALIANIVGTVGIVVESVMIIVFVTFSVISFGITVIIEAIGAIFTFIGSVILGLLAALPMLFTFLAALMPFLTELLSYLEKLFA